LACKLVIDQLREDEVRLDYHWIVGLILKKFDYNQYLEQRKDDEFIRHNGMMAYNGLSQEDFIRRTL
jgi:hypothetical protein